MSRSHYTDDCEYLELYRASVDRAIRGARGQRFLKELAAALDEMPDKALIADKLEEDGEVCALGAVGKRRGLEMEGLDYTDPESMGNVFGIARCLAAEVEYVNDEWAPGENPEHRWQRMRKWVAGKIVEQVA